MKVVVVFDFPYVKDVDSDYADLVIEELTSDLVHLHNRVGYDWTMEEAFND
jgi:hypothetical protein